MKKFLAMTMALALVLSLAACGAKEEPATPVLPPAALLLPARPLPPLPPPTRAS